MSVRGSGVLELVPEWVPELCFPNCSRILWLIFGCYAGCFIEGWIKKFANVDSYIGTSRADLDLQPMTPPTRCGISLFFRRSNQRSGEMGGDVTCVCQSCPWHATIHMKSNILWPDPATTHGPCHGPSLLIKQTPQGFPGLFIEHICDRSNSRKKERTKPARNSWNCGMAACTKRWKRRRPA